MLVFDKDKFQEYCKMWEPAYYNNSDAIKWAEKNHGKKVKEYISKDTGFVQFRYVDDGKGGKDLISTKWCKEV